jgi:hypothetical protein
MGNIRTLIAEEVFGRHTYDWIAGYKLLKELKVGHKTRRYCNDVDTGIGIIVVVVY